MPRCRGGGLMGRQGAGGSGSGLAHHRPGANCVGEFVSLSATLPTVSAREGVAEDSYSVRSKRQRSGRDIATYRRGVGSGAGMTRVAGTEGTIWIDNGTVKVTDRNGTRDLPVTRLPARVLSRSISGVELGAHTQSGPACRLDGGRPPTSQHVAACDEPPEICSHERGSMRSAGTGRSRVPLRSVTFTVPLSIQMVPSGSSDTGHAGPGPTPRRYVAISLPLRLPFGNETE